MLEIAGGILIAAFILAWIAALIHNHNESKW
jgi:hypothetical protein